MSKLKNRKLCLHLASGSVYLKSDEKKQWINIDFQGVSSRVRPDIVRHNETTVDKYYKYPFRSNLSNDCYDIKMDVTDLSPFEDNSVDEILAVNLLEHLTKADMLKAVEDHWFRVLKPDGLLILDTPDIVKTCQEVIRQEGNWEEMEERMYWLFCHGRTFWDIHRWGYMPEYLNELLAPWFEFVKTDNKYINHDAGYPYFINFYKPRK